MAATPAVPAAAGVAPPRPELYNDMTLYVVLEWFGDGDVHVSGVYVHEEDATDAIAASRAYYEREHSRPQYFHWTTELVKLSA